MEKFGFVYIWFDRKHKRYYVGMHWGLEDDGYICSSTWMNQAYKLRPEDFKRRILSRVYTNKFDLLTKEHQWLSLMKESELKGSRYYNMTKHLNGHWTTQTEDKLDNVKQRISNKTKEAMQRPEVRENFLEGLKTRDCKSSDPDVREKRRQSMKKTMAEKFPEENRWKKLSPEERTQYYSDKAKEIWSKPGHRENVGAKIAILCN